MANLLKGSDARLALNIDGLGAGQSLNDSSVDITATFFIKDAKSTYTQVVEKEDMVIDETGKTAEMVVSTSSFGLGKLCAEISVTYTDSETSKEVTEIFNADFAEPITIKENE